MAKANLEQLMTSLRQDTLRMGALVERSVTQGMQALFTRDLALAEQVIMQDELIDQLYHKLEEDCLLVLAFHTPLARDLRYIGTVLQLIRDLERIGDYAVDICEEIPRLILYPPLPHMARVKIMSGRCQDMLTQTLTALANLDPFCGRRLVIADDLVDEDYDSLYQLLAGQPCSEDSVEPLLLVLLIIRYLERMADHAVNIALRVGFIVTGER